MAAFYTFLFTRLSSSLKSWDTAVFAHQLNGSNSVAVAMRRSGIESREVRGPLHRTIVSRGLCPCAFFPCHFFPASFQSPSRQKLSAISKVDLVPDCLVCSVQPAGHMVNRSATKEKKSLTFHLSQMNLSSFFNSSTANTKNLSRFTSSQSVKSPTCPWIRSPS